MGIIPVCKKVVLEITFQTKETLTCYTELAGKSYWLSSQPFGGVGEGDV